jgi:hypothetical protein
MTEVKPGGGFPHAAEPYDPTKLRTIRYPKGTRMDDKKYRLAKDVIIAAGTAVDVDPVGTNVRYDSPHACVKIAVTNDITAEWAMDLEEAVEQGIVEAVSEEGAAA